MRELPHQPLLINGKEYNIKFFSDFIFINLFLGLSNSILLRKIKIFLFCLNHALKIYSKDYLNYLAVFL